MKNWKVKFSSQTVSFFLEGKFAAIDKIVDKTNTFYITDENVYGLHEKKFKGKKTIVIPSGEEHKHQTTVDFIIESLLNFGATREAILIGVGGGVVTDMVGYVAGIYMRGVAVGFVPTTILAMVDASIGGKNGIDVGLYKNMVGLIRQPSFLLYDLNLLTTLPKHQWENGFAEIIKHAAIKDAAMMKDLARHDLTYYQKNKKALALLIFKNVKIKAKVVQEDEFEKGDRKLLNFGHTLGHAIENQYALLHGHAISIGMVYAAKISQVLEGFKDTGLLVDTLKKYGLPTSMHFEINQALQIMQRDKKKIGASMQYVLLKKMGKAVYQNVPMKSLEKLIKLYS
ncbi:MAG: 3-dehydroquinate synthase [Chitinophagia bacterium]|nr:3-dehydroquinate synthase [Chitinophagia bacterium]NCA30434.1 3-dehydroquinate synthase [Chitinophagia bacterium]